MRIVRSKIPELDGLPLAEYRVAFAKRQRRLNIAANLTHDGRTRQRPVRVNYPELANLPAKERVVKRVQLWRERRYAQGLPQRGGDPAFTPQAKAYAALKAELQAAPKVFPLATGFCAKALPATSTTAGTRTAFMNNLVTRGRQAAGGEQRKAA